ncbi:DUF262 domain-containing protein [Streptococcus equinus]|uniref:DUF262 domain-containing protein n=1 Tax=Streptococcus equinus TaxID=1335 RepID=UPI003BF8C301
MSEKNTCLTVKDLLQGKYKIPLYQRNFAWTYDEIEQLIVDVADACKEKKNAYYIGTLVVDSGNNIIDGQQRTTALTLIALALRKYDSDHLIKFEARKQSNKTLAKLLEYVSNSNEELKEVKTSHDFESDELTIGFDNAIKALKKVLDEDKKLDRETFSNYLFEHVKIFQTELSTDLDLNLYFERFNSRGEQLQAHEIIKAQMMDVLKDNAEEAQQFSKIWEACSQMDRPVILAFKHKSKSTDESLEREKIFSGNYDDYQLKDIYDNMEAKEVGRYKLSDYLNNSNEVTKEKYQENDLSTYRPLVNFETLLYYVFYLTEGTESNEITLDDKKLLATFEQKLNALNDDTKHDWVIKFSENLLRLRFIFDNFIIQNSFEDNNRDETNWTLKKAVRQDKNGGWKYVQFQNTFDNNQGTIIQLQSMFAVTFTSNRDTKWLYETMSFLFKNSSQLVNDNFSVEFKYFLEKLAVKFAEERIFIKNHEIKSYQESVPVYAFNFIDYILWTKRDEEQFTKVFSDAKNFKFRYRQSIEHWYPQNPNEEDTNLKKLDDNYLHSIGNLCLITQSQNSKFSNSRPQAKAKWKDDFSTQSLKLQWMKYITDKEQQWSKKQIDKMSKEVNQYVNDFIDSVSKS